MAGRKAIELVAKMLARATMTDNEPEAQAALKGAYARMKRDSVTLEDILSLPDDALYQQGLMALVGLIVADSPELSEAGKRERYSKYAAQISRRFSEGASEQRSEPHQDEAEQKTYKRSYANTDGSGFSASAVFSPDGAKAVVRNMLTITANSFRQGGFMWCALRNPGATLRLIAVATIFGLGFGLLLLIVAASLHSWLGLGGPWIDMKFKTAWIFVSTAIGVAKIVYLHRRGWY